jgi:hypothetical protein
MTASSEYASTYVPFRRVDESECLAQHATLDQKRRPEDLNSHHTALEAVSAFGLSNVTLSLERLAKIIGEPQKESLFVVDERTSLFEDRSIVPNKTAMPKNPSRTRRPMP